MAEDIENESIRISELPETTSVDKSNDCLVISKTSDIYSTGSKSYKITPQNLLKGVGVDYTAGDNITISDDNVISATIPTASSSDLGGVKVGSGLSIDNEGVLSATGGGGGASSFSDLDDVSINEHTLVNGQVPIYNSNSAKWENGMISGGSGHIILDDEGTSLTQRTNLQFNGAYSEDNSTDDTTKVNVVRGMTKAEFDLLSADEKTGFINITDITGGNDDRFQPVIYSTEEREIGVWVDGKPLYQKTLVIAGTSLTAGQSNVITHGISDIDYVQLVNGTYTFGDGDDKLPLPFADNYKPVTDSVVVIEAISSSSIRIGVGLNYQGAVSPNTVWVTVQYTKTTDQAGSGQWTPQGVPAHHYSTDEQVVGTWIDGSTLYERTIEYSHTTQGAQTVSLPTGVVWSNIKNIVAIVKNETDVQSMYIFDATNRFSVRANSTDGIIVTMGSSYPAVPATVTITIRYTKSSS